MLGQAFRWHNVSGNTIDTNGSDAYGIYMEGDMNGTAFADNIITSRQSSALFLNRVPQVNFTREKIAHSSKGISISGEPPDQIFFRDSKLENNTIDIDAKVASGKVVFINTTMNKTKISSGGGARLFFKWYIDINVTAANSPLASATVEAFDSLNNLEDTRSTDGDGKARMEVSEFYREGDINYFITPSRIVVSKGNFTENTTSISLINITSAAANLSITEFTCGSTLSTNARLGNNFTCKTMTALTISANNIVLDGQRNFLVGNSSGTGLSITGSHVTVKNLNVSNFTNGILLSGTANVTIQNLLFQNVSRGVVLSNAADTGIINSSFISAYNVTVSSFNNEGSNTSLTNVSLDVNSLNASGTANIFLKWYVDVNTTFNENLALGLANASAFVLSSGALENSKLTDSKGSARLTVAELKKNGSEITYLTPHNITLTFTLFGTTKINETIINLTRSNNTRVNLSLALNCTAPSSGQQISSATTLCPGTFVTNGTIITANHVNVTCANTQLDAETTADTGMTISGVTNVSVTDCTFRNFFMGVLISNTTKVTINSVNTSESSIGINCFSSRELTVKNSRLSDETEDLLLFACNSSVIINNTFKGSKGIIFHDVPAGTITNNTFQGLQQGILFSIFRPSTNLTIYANNFTSNVYNVYYWDLGRAGLNDLLTVNFTNNYSNYVAGYPQGNEWSDYCDKGSDTNSDGFADAGQNTSEWPYSENISSKILDYTTNNYGVIDYGPKKVTCPVTDVFLGSSGGGSSAAPATAATAAPAEAPAPVSGTTERGEEVEQFSSLQDIQTALKTEPVQAKHYEGVTEVTIVLENTGDKRMELFTKISQEIEEPFYLVTRNTLGLQNSLFERISGFAYSDAPIAERLLHASLVNPEHIFLNPGERVESTLMVKDGFLAPKELKVQFTALGEVVKEQEVPTIRKTLSGTAVDVDADASFVDIYAFILPAPATEQLEQRAKGEQPLTGAASSSLPAKREEHWVEVIVTEKKSKRTAFIEFYGPYLVKQEQGFLFAQQLLYDFRRFSGQYIVRTKVYRGTTVLVENEFEVEL